MRLHFSAAKLHLVAGAEAPSSLRVHLDGGPMRELEVSQPSPYTLLDGDAYGERLLEVEADGPGLSLFSATFG